MDFLNDTPIYIQIMNLIKADIVSGKIQKGEKLMSTRELAIELKVNPNTIQRVFRELENEQICYTKRGMGTYVTDDDRIVETLKAQLATEKIEQFIIGMKQLNFSLSEIIDRLRMYEEAQK